MSKPTLIVVVGPTAVGKTALCVRLAKHFQTEIVSADSRQFYQEMSIGTAKPTLEEMEGVPHHLVDQLSIEEDYNVGKFEQDALQALEDVFSRHDCAILTGGSGLFIKAVCEGIDQMPTVLPTVRESLNQEFKEKGLLPLLEELRLADEAYFQEVDQKNHARVIRALEVIRSSGKPFSEFRKSQPAERPFNTIKIGLNRDREELYDRINRRMDLMLAGGLFEEAKSLYAYREKNALQTVGYQEIFSFMNQEYDYARMVELLKQNSRRYAKRQLTWFRRDEEIEWFHPDQEDEIQLFIEKGLKA